MSELKRRIEGGALSYAIVVVLLLGLFSSSLLFISKANQQLSRIAEMKEHLIFNNLLALNIGKSSNDEVIYHLSGDTSLIKRKKWGLFEVLHVRTFSNNLSVEKTVLISQMYKLPQNILYINDQRQAVNVAGDTKFIGDVQVSPFGFQNTILMGKELKTSSVCLGKLSESKNSLPELCEEYKNISFLDKSNEYKSVKSIIKDTSFSFDENTLLLEDNNSISIKNKLKGNIIIHSFDSIFVSRNAKLENVILISPIVYFESGFKGSVQVLASKRIHCSDSVKLLYPSILILNEQSFNSEELNQEHSIYLGAGALILGGLLLEMQEPNFRNPVTLQVNGSLIYGFIYNQGNSQLIGTLSGFLYTHNTFIRNKYLTQYSCFLDAKIDGQNLPEKEICINWIKQREFVHKRILCQL